MYSLDRLSTDGSATVTPSTVFGLLDAGMNDFEGFEVGAEGRGEAVVGFGLGGVGGVAARGR